MLSLDYRDARPIYEQVRDGLRRLVAVSYTHLTLPTKLEV